MNDLFSLAKSAGGGGRMKRFRDDSISGPQVKRAASVRSEMSEPLQIVPSSSSSAQKLTTDDALAYLKAVKDMFKDDKDKYDEFLEVMKDFKAQRIDTAGVIMRVKDLFKGHRALILGFNAFLPKGYEITLPIDEELPTKKQPVEFDQAINYVNKIKTRFQSDEQVYKAFLEILNMYRKGNKSISEVYHEVASLFHEHADLLEEFTYFLPDSTGPVIVTPSSRPSIHQIIRREERNHGLQFGRHSQNDKSVKKERMILVERGLDRQPDREHEPERIVRLDREQRKKVDRDKKEDYERINRLKEESDLEKDKDLDLLQRLPHKRKSARRADELIRKQSQAGESGEVLHTLSIPNLPTDDKSALKCTTLHKEQLAFFDRVKGRLRNRDTYQEFLKCLNIFSQEIISRAELQHLVADILGKHTDLMEGFNEFLSRRENLEGYIAGFVSGKKLDDVEGTTLKPKVEKDSELEKDRDREKDMDYERERDKEQRDRDRAVPYSIKEGASQKMPVFPSKEKPTSKPVSDLDLSNCERCTPSYRLLPKNYLKPISSYRTMLAHQVLNDNWVSVTSGSEDYSFKHMRKNQYEESLFRCEDDRFELDMLLESTAVTARSVAELLDKLRDPNLKQEHPFHLDDHLTAINMRCIERIYGDHGLDFLELVRKNAPSALSVVLTRLKQKQEEWSRCRADMNKVWAEVYTKNYYKSLDHRSFYFKQQDKKSLSTKCLLVEIKDINEKNRREDANMLAVVAGNRRPLTPDLRFQFSDSCIHEDLYQIVKYSTDEVCASAEQSDRIMRIWTSFLEPMFGVSPRLEVGFHKKGDALQSKLREEMSMQNLLGEKGLSGDVGSDTLLFQQVTSDPRRQVPGDIADNCGHTFQQSSLVQSVCANNSIPNSEFKVGVVQHKVSQYSCGQYESHENVLSTNSQGRGLEMRSADGGKQEERTGMGDLTFANVARRSAGAVSSSFSSCRLFDGDGVVSESSKIHKGAPLGSTQDCSLGERISKVWNCAVDTTDSQPKFDREEGELSPTSEVVGRGNVQFVLDNNLDSCTDKVSSEVLSKDYTLGTNTIRYLEDVEMEHDNFEREHEDEGEDSGQKSSDDSENLSEAGEDISGSDFAEADDASHDDQEDEEDDYDERGEKMESEVEGNELGDGDVGGTSPLASRVSGFSGCKPLASHTVFEGVATKEKSVFYGNDIFYILFRLHQTLYERILSAKINALAAEQKWKSLKDSEPPNFYSKFLRNLYNLLDGSTDNARFEDECRAIIGTQSYVLFTLDKLIFKLVKQLQAVSSDEVANKLLSLYAYESCRRPGLVIDLVYYANTCVLLQDDNIYRLEHRSKPMELHIQLMENGSERVEVAPTLMGFSFSSYLNNFLVSLSYVKDSHRVFLSRNKRKYERDGEDNIMAYAEVLNGLEYKISCNTFKVSYVLDTEDFFHRLGRQRLRKFKKHDIRGQKDVSFGNKWPETRVSRFHNWISKYVDDSALFNKNRVD